ncbi:MAG: mechanosensitive ion channel [Moraxellaceae bacterium]|nr:mechanosensitive ion channel [Moraxellaceae bacterium]
MDIFAFIYNLDWSSILEKAFFTTLNVIVAIIIFLVGRFIAKKVSRKSKALMERNNIDPTITSFFVNLIFFVIITAALMVSLNKIGINTSSVVAIIGGMSVAVGLALKDQMSNFASGLLIIFSRPIKKGDFIQVGESIGFVKEISLRTTSIITPSNDNVILPNDKLVTNKLINFSSTPDRRIDILFTVSYKSDINLAQKIMYEEAINHPLTITEGRKVKTVIKAVNNGSVDLRLRFWTINHHGGTLKYALIDSINRRFKENGIRTSFPQEVLSATTVVKKVVN